MIYEVRAQKGERVVSFGSRMERAEAEVLLAETEARVTAVGGSNDRYWIEEIDTTGLFQIPSKPTPRERYGLRVEVVASSRPGVWGTSRVTVVDGERVVGKYDRNYPGSAPFEPFRQGDRDFALVSRDYTATSVMDLATGEIIAGEERDTWGFCPVGFYVPDWWDVHDGSVRPGTLYWGEDDERPRGDFGFVWGCVWGDDSSWKVQYLDLSGIQEGRLGREERFGYVELETGRGPASDFIRYWPETNRVVFSSPRYFDLATGKEERIFDD